MDKSIDKLERWIKEQVVYADDGSINAQLTSENFLMVCGENGNVEIKTLALATGIARSQFYNVKVVVERVATLRERLNKEYPNNFVGSKDSKKIKQSKEKPIEVEAYNKKDEILKELSRDKSRLEKQLHEERSKIEKLEKENESLKKRLQLYYPTIRALQNSGAMPSLPPINGVDT
jgi:septal ring factor EnvC (AmiA/AmiB activator)